MACQARPRSVTSSTDSNQPTTSLFLFVLPPTYALYERLWFLRCWRNVLRSQRRPTVRRSGLVFIAIVRSQWPGARIKDHSSRKGLFGFQNTQHIDAVAVSTAEGGDAGTERGNIGRHCCDTVLLVRRKTAQSQLAGLRFTNNNPASTDHRLRQFNCHLGAKHHDLGTLRQADCDQRVGGRRNRVDKEPVTEGLTTDNQTCIGPLS